MKTLSYLLITYQYVFPYKSFKQVLVQFYSVHFLLINYCVGLVLERIRIDIKTESRIRIRLSIKTLPTHKLVINKMIFYVCEGIIGRSRLHFISTVQDKYFNH